MSAVWIRIRSELRHRWRAWFGLALFIGLFGGAIIAAAAGARRTDTAYPRFLRATKAYDMLVGLGFFDPCCAAFTFDQLKDLPQVDIAVPVLGVFAFEPQVTASSDPRFGRTIAANKILEGRAPNPSRAEEVLAPFDLARVRKWHVGDVVETRTVVGPDAALPPIKLHIVGIGAAPGDFPPYFGGVPAMIGTSAFYARYEPLSKNGRNSYSAAMFRLKHGAASIEPFHDELDRVGGGKVIGFTDDQRDTSRNIQRSFALQGSALWLVAAAAGLAAILVFSQTLSRETFLESTEYPTLRSLGMTESELFRLAMVRAVTVAAVGAVVAVVVAVALSPIFPTGLARVAEPDPGVAFDAIAAGIGVVAIIVVVTLLELVPARRAARVEGGSLGVAEVGGAKPSATVGAMSRMGLPPSAVAGVRLALEPGRGRTAVPVRTTILGVTLGIAALATAVGFDASLSHLLATPRLYGQTWDAQFSSGNLRSTAVADVIVPTLRDDRRVAAMGTGTTGLPLIVGGQRVGSIAVDDVQGNVSPVVRSGHLPRTDREILLGQRTLRTLHKKVGDLVPLSFQGVNQKLPMRISGTGVIPAVGANARFGEGVMVHYGVLPLICGCSPPPPPDTVFVRFKPGVDAKRVVPELRKTLRAKVRQEGFDVSRPERPTDLVNFGRVQSFPLILAGLLGALAAAVLAHALISVIRRRRRDLAILKTLGFLRGQVRRTVAWQASSLVVIALAIGLPLGVGLGRVLWTGFANAVGVVPEARAPMLLLGAAIPAGLLLANIIAARPARNAAHTSPAIPLRTE
jgi:ABC-type antimicrobial peptide transport system permease subunit